LLETDEQIRRALPRNEAGQTAGRKPVRPAPADEEPSSPADAVPYHPTLRPPTAILTVFDDGKSDGEVLRIRNDRFVIGRTEGDLLVPHDSLISGRHVEITRQRMGEHFRWLIRDQQTTNGLFVRVSRTALADKAEFLVGKGRYRYEAAESQRPTTVSDLAADAPTGSTSPQGAEVASVLHPVLVELAGGKTLLRLPLTNPEYWIGSDPACVICRANDPFVESRHVRLYRDPNDVWNAQNNKSPNGLWLRVAHITVDEGCLFQIGEQRFRLTVGGQP
jgi:pSer/pThr/pTyr-binding forkhead associated (FHA) protein